MSKKYGDYKSGVNIPMIVLIVLLVISLIFGVITWQKNGSLQKELDAQVNELTAEATGLQEQLTAATGDKAALEEQVTALTGDKTALEEQVNTLTGDKTALEEQVTTLTGDKTALEEQVTTLTGDKTALEEQVTTLTGEKAALETQVTELTELNAAKSGEQTISSEKTPAEIILEGKVTELEGKVTELEGKVSGLASEKTTLEQQNEQLTSEKEALEAKIASLEAQASQQPAAAAVPAEQNNASEVLSTEITALTEQKDALAADITALTQAKDNLTASITELTAKNDELTAANTALKDASSALSAEKDTLTVDVAALTESYDSLNKSVSALMTSRDSLSAEVAELTESKEGLAADIDAMTQQKEQLQADIDALTEYHASITERNGLIRAASDRTLETVFDGMWYPGTVSYTVDDEPMTGYAEDLGISGMLNLMEDGTYDLLLTGMNTSETAHGIWTVTESELVLHSNDEEIKLDLYSGAPLYESEQLGISLRFSRIEGEKRFEIPVPVVPEGWESFNGTWHANYVLRNEAAAALENTGINISFTIQDETVVMNYNGIESVMRKAELRDGMLVLDDLGYVLCMNENGILTMDTGDMVFCFVQE